MSNHEYNTNNYTPLKTLYVKWFKKPHIVTPNEIGIYKYIFLMDTVNEASHSHRYNIYAKIKAVHVYDELVEIEVIDFHINEPITDDLLTIIKKSIPKYVNPKLVQWEIKNKN